MQGVIAAAALKCMGGSIQGRLWARNEEEAEAIRASGRDTTRILYTEDLVRGNDVSVGLVVAYVHCSNVLWVVTQTRERFRTQTRCNRAYEAVDFCTSDIISVGVLTHTHQAVSLLSRLQQDLRVCVHVMRLSRS
jgi:fructose-1,6-bisphosphatase/sedoheptulose 1,7-bisphosphatase-like protein